MGDRERYGRQLELWETTERIMGDRESYGRQRELWETVRVMGDS